MKRRLRKKLYLDEFKIMGFSFDCDANCKGNADTDRLLDEFVDFIESRNLLAACGVDLKSLSGFVYPSTRYGAPSTDDLAAVKSFLESNELIERVNVGKLIDANYDPSFQD